MATFDELMNEFRTPPEGGMRPELVQEISDAYLNDISIRDAAVQEREAALSAKELEIAERDKEVTRLKAVNYDLLVAAPKPGETPDNDNENNDGGNATGVDSLFE